jgi:hypothetical protein
MQGPPPPPPSENDQAPISPETVSNGSDMNPTVIVRRKAAKRTLPFDLVAEELLPLSSSSPPPQAEDIPAARKKQRLEVPLPATRDEAARKTASPNLSVGLPAAAAAAAADDDDANTDSMTDTQPNAGSRTRATGSWTLEEDAKLTRAVANTSKKKHGKDYRTDWATISALVPGRTKTLCRDRWHVLGPSVGGASGLQINGQQSKKASCMMQYRRTVTRIGVQLQRWFWVEWKVSVLVDGMSCGVVPSKSEAAVELAFPPTHSMVWKRCSACAWPTYLTPKPSTTRDNVMGRVAWVKRPGV